MTKFCNHCSHAMQYHRSNGKVCEVHHEIHPKGICEIYLEMVDSARPQGEQEVVMLGKVCTR